MATLMFGPGFIRAVSEESGPMPVEFLFVSLVVVLIPGTGVIYTLSCALSRGRNAGIAAALGCTFGIMPHIAASLLGLAAILHTSAVLFQVLKYAGVAYLLYLAWKTLRETGTLAVTPTTDTVAFRQIVVRGILVNILNPKLSLFFLAFLPQFVDADATGAVAYMVALSGVFMAMTLVVFAGYGLAAAALRQHVVSNPAVMQWLRRGFAGAFALLGLRLALAER
ncbi:LysE family translocator [Virgifigura deserti]|uniref:LysE family translocator n=1 Tax=Virgifigura deserti TaxID=2268457 RepID=UPI003CCBF574